MIQLNTTRLALRPLRDSDYIAFVLFFTDNDYTKYLGGQQTAEQAWRLLATYIGHWHLKGFGYLAVEEKASNKFVGCVGLWKSDPWPELELGYWMVKEMQGKGYATEFASALKEYAFEEMKVETLVSYTS